MVRTGTAAFSTASLKSTNNWGKHPSSRWNNLEMASVEYEAAGEAEET